MHHGAIGRPELGRFHPLVFGESAGNDDVGVVDYASGRHLIFDRHLDHIVRLPDVPAFQPLHGLRLILGVAFRRTRVHPGHQRLDVGVAQAAIVRKMAISRVCKPGRHLLDQHRLLDRFRPGTRLLISQQRHRTNFAGAVAFLAILLQDRRYVPVKGNRFGGRQANRASQQRDQKTHAVPFRDDRALDGSLGQSWQASLGSNLARTDSITGLGGGNSSNGLLQPGHCAAFKPFWSPAGADPGLRGI